MAATKRITKGTKRDTTRALDIVRSAPVAFVPSLGASCYILAEATRNELVAILTDVDARTGRRDPSKRGKKRTVTKRAGKAAKKAGARRR